MTLYLFGKRIEITEDTRLQDVQQELAHLGSLVTELVQSRQREIDDMTDRLKRSTDELSGAIRVPQLRTPKE